MALAGDDLDEASQQRPHQIGGERVGCRLAAADEDVGQQRQPQGMAVRPARPPGRGGPGRRRTRTGTPGCPPGSDCAAKPPATAHATPDRRASPPTRCGPSGEHHEGGGRQTRQQSRAHPVIDRCQLLVAVEQNHHPATVGRPGDGPLSIGHLQHLAQRLEDCRRRREEIAAVKPDHDWHRHRWRAQRNGPTTSSCRYLVVRRCGAPEMAGPASRARPETARPRIRGRRIVAAGPTPTVRRACHQTASQSYRRIEARAMAPIDALARIRSPQLNKPGQRRGRSGPSAERSPRGVAGSRRSEAGPPALTQSCSVRSMRRPL